MNTRATTSMCGDRPRRVAVLLCAVVFTCAQMAHAQVKTSKLLSGSIREVLESIELETIEGERVQLSSFLDKGPVVFDFWATWCKPCLVALPELSALAVDLGAEGVQVVAINEDGPRNAAKVKPFVQTKDYAFTVLLDLNEQAKRKLNALTLPTTIVVDADGNVVHTSFGYRPGEGRKLRKLVESMLDAAEKTKTEPDD